MSGRKSGAKEIAARLRGVKVGSRFYGGQSTNRSLVPFNDSKGTWILFHRESTIVRETPSFWIDAHGRWWRKSDGLSYPASAARIYLVPVDGGVAA